MITNDAKAVSKATSPQFFHEVYRVLKLVQSKCAKVSLLKVRAAIFFCNGATFNVNAIPEITKRIVDHNPNVDANALLTVIRKTPGKVKYLSPFLILLNCNRIIFTFFVFIALRHHNSSVIIFPKKIITANR